MFEHDFADDVPFDIEDEWELPYRQCMTAGLRVMPLHPIVNGACGCGNEECAAIGKHPVGSWSHTPVWDDDQVKTMRVYLKQLHPSYGVLVRDSLLVVDVDERNGGVESFARLQKDLGIKLDGGFAVQSGSGGGSSHRYFRVSGEPVRLRQSLPDYPGIDFKSSGYVVGWGSAHKSGMFYERMHGYPEDIGAPPEALMALLKTPVRVASSGGEFADVSHADIAQMLEHITDADTYESYIKVGMGIHSATGGSIEGQELFHVWASKSAKYSAEDVDRRWHSFGKYQGESVTLATIVKLAIEGGYETPVTFHCDDFEQAPPETSHSIVMQSKHIQPWDMPGVAGQLYNWLDGQCRYPRPTIAAGATLYALSSIGGMRHFDERDGLPLNMMVFAVSGTGTGKESIGQSVTELFSRVGIVAAMHGKIKSEQEIYRNLIDHRAAFYSIDELGIMLQKINGATKSGGAVYLTGVIGALMEIYSKADGILAITGDLKKEIKEMILREIAQINKRIEDGKPLDSDEQLLAIRQDALRSADQGIDSPYLTVFGTTTPTTFDSVITPENAQNGFIARALILREHEDNPRWRTSFKKAELSMGLEATLNGLYYGGNSRSETVRIDVQDEKQAIATTEEAGQLLDEAYEYFWQLGELHKDKTGLVGITRRGWEMASKISLVLAMADRSVRTASHVLYGFAMARRDVDLKIEYAYSADDKADNSVILKLLSRLSEATGTTHGQVNRLLRGVSVAGGTAAFLEALEVRGLIRSEEVVPETGRRAVKLFYRV